MISPCQQVQIIQEKLRLVGFVTEVSEGNRIDFSTEKNEKNRAFVGCFGPISAFNRITIPIWKNVAPTKVLKSFFCFMANFGKLRLSFEAKTEKTPPVLLSDSDSERDRFPSVLLSDSDRERDRFPSVLLSDSDRERDRFPSVLLSDSDRERDRFPSVLLSDSDRERDRFPSVLLSDSDREDESSDIFCDTLSDDDNRAISFNSLSEFKDYSTVAEDDCSTASEETAKEEQKEKPDFYIFDYENNSANEKLPRIVPSILKNDTLFWDLSNEKSSEFIWEVNNFTQSFPMDDRVQNGP